jgi:hypothetical protein
MPLRALSERRQADQYARGTAIVTKLSLTARYRIAKARVFAWCVLAGLAGFFVPWLVWKAMH